MAEYTDYQLEVGEYGKSKEFGDDDAVILAIRNLLLSRPGNFPFNPSIGINIKKYQFDLLDEETISDIKSEIDRQIAQYIPSLGNVEVKVLKIEDENLKPYLAISISSNISGNPVDANFLIGQDGDDIKVFNEIN